MAAHLPCLSSPAQCASKRLPGLQQRPSAMSMHPDSRFALQPGCCRKWRTSAAGVEEQFLMENFQTDAGIVETVDLSDDEVRLAVNLL